MRPANIAKGVDKHGLDVHSPEPMFKQKPFENYAALQYQDTRLMGYDAQGAFTATSMQRASHEEQFRQMAQNNSLVNLVNGKRRGEF